LQAVGIRSLVAGRSKTPELQLDANKAVSIRTAVSAGDLMIDTAGPFQHRSLALVQAAIDVGFDVIDINDNLHYAEQILAFEKQIAAAGIRVLSSASSVSAFSAAAVEQSGVSEPMRITAFLAPASRHTANRGTALSLIETVGQPVRAFRDGRLQTLIGWSEQRRFAMPSPLGPIRGRLFESADAIYLPRIWPTLQTVEMFVDANTLGVNTLLSMAARIPTLRRCIEWQIDLGVRISKRFGSEIGGIGYEIESRSGQIVRVAALSAKNSFVVAVAPAMLAAQAIIADQFDAHGLVLPDRQVKPAELWSFLESRGRTIKRF
jgi:hypothetical protein